ncbi:GH32 C-terminal domain-containing protein, partial [Staphylococcus sp. SIMBA_130]
MEIGEKSSFRYDAKTQICTFQRGEFSMNGVEGRHCVLESLQNIQIFKDTSSIEIFINNGEEVFTSRVFDNPDVDEIRFIA